MKAAVVTEKGVQYTDAHTAASTSSRSIGAKSRPSARR